jgi:hypothetical protein
MGSLCRFSSREAAENVFIESFNGKFREECLNEHGFLNLAEATVRAIEAQGQVGLMPEGHGAPCPFFSGEPAGAGELELERHR